MSATEGGGDPAKAWVPLRGKPDQQVGDAAGRDPSVGKRVVQRAPPQRILQRS
jgi:hypothetical protein